MSRERETRLCDLCGLPVGKWETSGDVRGRSLSFCCPGCRQVFLVLAGEAGCLPADFRDLEIFKACVRAGIVAAPGELAGRTESRAGDTLAFTARVHGMWCPSCAWLIEALLRRTRGVADAQVSFLSDLARITYRPHLTSPSEVLDACSHFGYTFSAVDDTSQKSRYGRDLRLRLGVAAILTANGMMLAQAVDAGFFHDLSAATIRVFSYPLLLMTAPVLFYAGQPILKRGLAGLWYGTASMDSLITVAALTAFVYSLVQVALGSIHLYFDTASMLVTLVLFGRYLEEHMREKASSSMRDLFSAVSRKARIVVEGEQRWVDAATLSVGAELLVTAGERVPLDGTIVSGAGELDVSLITGESRPRRATVGETVMAGSLLRGGELRLVARSGVGESYLGRMISLVEQGLERKHPAEAMADRLSRFFVPLVLGLAAATGLSLALWHRSFQEILLRTLTVLVVSCPCVLGIAVPLAKVALLRVSQRKGIIVREPAALERLREIDTVVLDKTGTLTEGTFTLRRIVAPGSDQACLLSRLAAVECHSPHFIAREVVRVAAELDAPPRSAYDFQAFEGHGVAAVVDGAEIFVGSLRLMEERGLVLSEELSTEAAAAESEGMTVVFFGWEATVKGLLVLGDRLQPAATRLVELLRGRGLDLLVVSGDSSETTRAIAGRLGITRFRGGALPGEKAEIVASLQRAGERVVMVGDGVNDAAALATADVGIGFAGGPDLAPETCDIIILARDVGKIGEAFDLSRLAARTIRRNLLFASVYNSVAIPVAMAGFLNPLIALFAMLASSTTLMATTLRIARSR